MTTGEKIRAMRKSKGMTLAQLAGKLDVTPSAVSQYERGKLEPSVAMLLRMSIVFECSIQALAGSNELKDFDFGGVPRRPSIMQTISDPCFALEWGNSTAVNLAVEGLRSVTFAHGATGTINKDGVFEVLHEDQATAVFEIFVEELSALCVLYEHLSPEGRARALCYMADLLHAPKFQGKPIDLDSLAKYNDSFVDDKET